MTPIMSRAEAGDLVRSARVRAGATWVELPTGSVPLWCGRPRRCLDYQW
jgi:hypothetical protein